MRIKLWFCWTERSPSGARTMNCSRETGITRICTRNSCWKKSSSVHEQSARRRSTRKSVRLAPDEAASEVYEAVSVARRAGAGAGGGGDAAGTGAADYFPTRNRSIFCAGIGPQDIGGGRVERGHPAERGVPARADLRFPRAIFADPDYAEGRATD